MQKLDNGGNFLMAYGSNGAGPVQFAYPRGIAVTPAAVTPAKVYVVDTNNSRLQAFDPSAHPNSSWSYNQVGNMTNNNGMAYTYGSSKPHAVTQVGSSTFYTYDSNGNMTDRAGMSLTWDVENRLVSVPGLADFNYDGDGFRVKKLELGTNIVYANKYYEKNINTGVVTLYYYLGDKMVAYKQGTTLRYIHQDHLTGTSLTTDSSGNLAGAIKYKPYGEARSPSGPLPAQKFTGQRLDDIGLYYYGARYYDPALGRFISADKIVPKLTDPQLLNRYGYTLNNPLKYTDPDGRIAWLAVAAIVIAVVNYASTAHDAYELVKEPSWANLGWLALDFVDPSPVPWGAGRKAAKLAVKEAAEEAGQKAAQQATKSFPKNLKSFRDGLKNLTGKSDEAIKGLEAHHVFPRAYKEKFANAGIDIWDPQYGAWVKGSPEHQSWTWEHNYEWGKFFKDTPNPTIDQIKEKGRQLAKQFGYEVNY